MHQPGTDALHNSELSGNIGITNLGLGATFFGKFNTLIGLPTLWHKRCTVTVETIAHQQHNGLINSRRQQQWKS
jgi:hypothetical protein